MIRRICLFSSTPISIEEKKKYIDSFYPKYATYQGDKHKNQGFLYKFNSAIGFKDLVGFSDNKGSYCRPKVESPDEYLAPKHLLEDNMHVDFENQQSILSFYVPKQSMTHPNKTHSYDTCLMAEKFVSFLQKVFPTLEIEMSEVNAIPSPSLFEFSRDYFFKSLEKEIAVTLEFSSEQTLTQEELTSLLTELQPLSNDKIGIAQYKCDTCFEHSSGTKPFHIEVVYLTWYGKDIVEKTKKEYGDVLFYIKK